MASHAHSSQMYYLHEELQVSLFLQSWPIFGRLQDLSDGDNLVRRRWADLLKSTASPKDHGGGRLGVAHAVNRAPRFVQVPALFIAFLETWVELSRSELSLAEFVKEVFERCHVLS